MGGLHDIKSAALKVLDGSLISLHACLQEASFTGRRRVRVGDTEYTADHVLIATGGKPSMPDIPGVEVSHRVFPCLDRIICILEYTGLPITSNQRLMSLRKKRARLHDDSSCSVSAVQHCIDSNGFFALEQLPKRVAVVGAGYIAVEMAGIFNSLGADTNLFVRFDGVLRNFDNLVRETLHKEMDSHGM